MIRTPSVTAEEDPDRVSKSAEVLLERIGEPPSLHLILGSGLSALADTISDPTSVGFEELPGFPAPTVQGHAGRFVSGRIGGVPVLIQAGRFHFYEGVAQDVVTAPVRVGRRIGAQALLVTNAAGGIRRDLVPGSLMLIDDHVNLQFRSALSGPLVDGDDRFPDMSAPYDRGFLAAAESVAASLGLPVPRGTYGAVLGPSYETPAEVRALARAGVDAVGMSTVPEVTCARALGQRVLGFSMISNLAAGLSPVPLSHDDVVKTGVAAGARLADLILELIPRLRL
ncbi:MAG: purine-nucleoside phosphorylase [Longimicrobiales bacterium]